MTYMETADVCLWSKRWELIITPIVLSSRVTRASFVKERKTSLGKFSLCGVPFFDWSSFAADADTLEMLKETTGEFVPDAQSPENMIDNWLVSNIATFKKTKKNKVIN
jgi:hypothetical protein